MSKIPVKDLFTSCEMMLAEKWGYIWGTSGEVWTQKKQKAATREMTVKYGSRWVGHRVTDCSGVMVWIWRQHGLSIYHGSNTIKRKYCGETQKKAVPGYAAFKVNGEDYHHIGIVAADGLNVYEAKGTQTGFVMSAASSWHCFAPFNDVDYTDPKENDLPVIWTGIVTTKTGRLNVRNGAGLEYAVIGALPKGEEVDVFKEENGWAYIAGDGLNGWVSMQFITPINAPETPTDPSDDGDGETPAPPVEPSENAILMGVWIPCYSEAEAQRYVGNIKGAVILRADKPPDAI